MKVPKTCDCCGKLFDFDSDDIPKFTSITEDNEYTELAMCDECKKKLADKLIEVMNNDKL